MTYHFTLCLRFVLGFSLSTLFKSLLSPTQLGLVQSIMQVRLAYFTLQHCFDRRVAWNLYYSPEQNF
jgi:hypothetical protein